MRDCDAWVGGVRLVDNAGWGPAKKSYCKVRRQVYDNRSRCLFELFPNTDRHNVLATERSASARRARA
jgi:hypothetical protein